MTAQQYPQLKFNADKSKVLCELKGDYLVATPEELVRQAYIHHLRDHYGYSFDQMDQERKTQHGHKSPRADVVIWASPADKQARKTPVIVVECKSDNVTIIESDYWQGESYTRAVGCELFVTHNNKQTRFFKLVPRLPGEWVDIEDIPHADDWGDAKKIAAIKQATHAFSREEFRRLLFDCHCILRDVHKMEPGRAFDEISKILFIKMYIERTGSWGKFTTDYLDQREAARLPNEPPVMDSLFELTRQCYKADDLFAANDRLEISETTFRRIVKKLERFNLSTTSDDVKGIAFEKFLGQTFRGELGQFFTPRPIVDFAVELLDPQEGETLCDPAAGSGGFLIRFFEYVRAKIEQDVQQQKEQRRAEIEAQHLPEEEEAAAINAAFAELNRQLDVQDDHARLHRLAHECIYGTDAEPRAARTSKMNMIMHGDGHGGIHYHDGFVDVNGIFPGRFDVVLTNPPFGANVGDDQKVGSTDETRLTADAAQIAAYKARFGEPYTQSYERMKRAAENKTAILNLYEIGKDKSNRPTEMLFLERCLDLLKPGGRMGIVLPEGILNNPSHAWLRRWCEGKARLLAVVSLPQETFASAKATVKASLLFLRHFTAQDEAEWEAAWTQAHQELDPGFDAQRAEAHAEHGPRIASYGRADLLPTLSSLESLGVTPDGSRWREPEHLDAESRRRAQTLKRQIKQALTPADRERRKALQKELAACLKEIDAAQDAALWTRVREIFDYPVFFAEPEKVGITSTGAEGPNDLPEVVGQYRRFEAWVESGAQPEATPNFQ